MTDARKALRDATLGARAVRPSKTVNVNGVDFLLVQPVVGEYEDAMRELRDDKGRVRDMVRFKFECIRLCAREPGSNAPVYEESDLAGFRELPLSCEWFDKLAEEAAALCVQKAKADGEALGKTTPAD